MDSVVVRRSAQDWAVIVDEFERSSMTRKAFAASQGINPRTLAWWMYELRARGRREPDFVEVELEPAAGAAAVGVVVEVAGTGHLIRVPLAFDADQLRRVVAALC